MFYYWTVLPTEVQEKVLLRARIFDLMRCRWTCKGMEKIIFNKAFQAKYCKKHGNAPNRFLFEKYLSREHRIFINVHRQQVRRHSLADWPATMSRAELPLDCKCAFRDMDTSGFHIMTIKNPATVRYRSPSPPPPIQDEQRYRSPSPPPPLQQNRSPSPPAPVAEERVWRYRSPSPPTPMRRSRTPSPPVVVDEERMWQYRSPSPPAPVHLHRSPTPPPIPVVEERVGHQRSPSPPTPLRRFYFLRRPVVEEPVPHYVAPAQPIPVVEEPVPRYFAPVRPIPGFEERAPHFLGLAQPRPVVTGRVPCYRAPVQPYPVVEAPPVQPGPGRVCRKRKAPSMPPPSYETQPHLYNVFYQSIFKSEKPIQIVNLSDSDGE